MLLFVRFVMMYEKLQRTSGNACYSSIPDLEDLPCQCRSIQQPFSNGHIVCHPCKDRIRQDTLLAKCPSCMVDLGNATSLIASRLVEKVKHECDNEGCDEMFDLSHLESHQKVCVFRKVRCPGSVLCKLEMSFNKVEEHVKGCRGIRKYGKA